jgi:hypothetical protein
MQRQCLTRVGCSTSRRRGAPALLEEAQSVHFNRMGAIENKVNAAKRLGVYRYLCCLS